MSLFQLAMMEMDSAGSIVFANVAAKALMDDTIPGRSAANLNALFSDEVTPALAAAMDRWVAVLPRSGGHKRWHLRSQEPLDDGSRLIILRRWDEPHYHGLALVEMLLNVREAEHTRWPFDGRVLVVDGEAMYRALSVSMLEGVGAGCYAVNSPTEALRLLEQDGELLFVLLDFELPNAGTRPFVEQVKTLRPDVTIVGISGGWPATGVRGNGRGVLPGEALADRRSHQQAHRQDRQLCFVRTPDSATTPQASGGGW